MATLDERLALLAILSPAGLRSEWRRLLKEEPPSLSPVLLRHGLAYAEQERELGKLAGKFRRMLVAGAPPASAQARLTAGTWLVRSCNGRTVEVLVLEDGFEFEGRTYRSLSAIAREVTGTAWSGPRFFGLTDGQG